MKKTHFLIGILFVFISIAYFVSRISNLTALPIFTDEAIYIRWAQIGGRDASWRFISLTDGKQPLFTWMMMATLRFFQEPLFAGRLASVIGGFFGLIGMYILGKEVFLSKKVGLCATLLYLISPFFVMYDRMALYDTTTAAISVWTLYLSILLIRRMRLDVSLLLGMSLGLGMLNKTSGFMGLYLLPITLFAFDCKSKKSVPRFFKWVGLAFISVLISQLIYSILRLSPFFYIIAQKDTIFIYPFSEWITHPFEFIQGNLHGMFDWLISYMTLPIFIVSLGAFVSYKEKIGEKLFLFLNFLMPFVGLALFGRILYPRHILFMAVPLYLLCAYSLSKIFLLFKGKVLAYVIIFALFIPSFLLSFRIIHNIKEAPITKSDRGQYIDDWPSGWGVKEIVEILREEARKGKIRVYTEGTFGLLPYALEIYLVDNPNIEIYGIWPLHTEMPEEVVESRTTLPTFFISNLTQKEFEWPMKRIAEYQKGTNPDSKIRLFEVERLL